MSARIPSDGVERRERFIRDMRAQGLSYAAVGRHMNLTGQRVAQLESKANRKLRRRAEQVMLLHYAKCLRDE